jgi:flagellar biosynthesis/type III secretory pathway protein FliH
LEIPQTSTDTSEREFLMTTQSLYEQLVEASREQGRQQERQSARQRYGRRIETSREQGRQEGRREGHQEAHKHTFALLYEARFGPLPIALHEALKAMNDTATLERWLVLVGTRAEPEVVAAMHVDSGASAR